MGGSARGQSQSYPDVGAKLTQPYSEALDPGATTHPEGNAPPPSSLPTSLAQRPQDVLSHRTERRPEVRFLWASFITTEGKEGRGEEEGGDD